jgi:hypothetical protein
MTPQEELALADRHIAEGEARILRQRTLVAELEVDGHDTSLAEALLGTMEQSLVVLHAHRRLILAEIAGRRLG